jgi:hypothetical protein
VPERLIIICIHKAMKNLLLTQALVIFPYLSESMIQKQNQYRVRNVLEFDFRKQKLADSFAGILDPHCTSIKPRLKGHVSAQYTKNGFFSGGS